MATTTNVALVAPIEEENLAPEAPEEEPSKKPEAAMATTTKATFVVPQEDDNPTLVVDVEEEEELKKVEAAQVEEAPNKIMVGGRLEEEEEDVRSEEKGGAFESVEAVVGGAKVDKGGNGNMYLEETKDDVKGGISGIAEAKKDDGSEESTTDDSEVSIYVVAPVSMPVLAVESKSENKGLGEENASLASLDVPKGEEKDELQGGQHDDIGVVMETKFLGMMVDDSEFAVSTEEKMEHEGEKYTEVVSVGVDDCEFGEEKESKVFVGSIEAIEQEDKADLIITKPKGELAEEKKESDHTVSMGGEEATEELINKNVDVEGETAKPEPVIDVDSMVVHDGSVKEVVPASLDSVVIYSPENEMNVEGQAITSEEGEDVGVKEPTKLENVATVVQDGFNKHTEIENIAIMVQDIDVMKSTEVKNIDVVVQCVGVEKATEVENVVVVVEGTDVDKPTENIDTMVEDVAAIIGGIDVDNQTEVEIAGATSFDGILSQELALKSINKENDVEEAKSATGIIDPCSDGIIKVVIHDADSFGNKADEDDDGAKSDTSPAQIIMLMDNLVKEQNDKGQTFVGEAVEDVTVEKPTNIENVAIVVEDRINNHTMAGNVVVVLEDVDVEKLAKVENIDVAAKVIATEKSTQIENVVAMVEGNDVKKLTEDKNVDVVLEDISVEKATEDENIVVGLEGVDIENPTKFKSVATSGYHGILSQELKPKSSKDNNGVEETECAIEGTDHVTILKTMLDEPDVVGNKDDKDDVMNSDMSPTRVKMLKSTKVVKQIMKELPKGSISDSEMEGDGGRGDSRKVEEAEEDAKDVSLGVAEAKKDDGSGDLTAQGMEVNFSVMAPKIVIATELKPKNKELGKEDASLSFPNASEGEVKGELQEEVGLLVETEPVDMVVDDEESAMAEENKLSPKCEKSNEVGCGGVDGYGFNEEEVEISIESIEATEPEDKVAAIAEVSDKLDGEKEERDDTMYVEGKEDIEESYLVEAEDEATIHKPVNEASAMVVNDESLEEVATTSMDIVLEDSLKKEGNAECQTTAGLGSSASSIGPTAPCQLARFDLSSPSELAVNVDPSEEMTQEEKKMHNDVELIQKNFLRLVYKLGSTPKETIVAQVMYRLSLAGGNRYGRQSNRAFNHDKAWKKVVLLEEEGKEDLDFSCNILVLGKSGVGKSATVNSIFGEAKSKTDAFSSATTSVQAFVGDVDGVKIRIIDTPGLRPNIMDQGVNRKILAAVKKYTKKFPPDVMVYVDRLDCLSYNLNDLPLLKTITSVLGSSIWFNTIVALTHAASTPPEGFSGAPMTYEVLMAQRSHIVQQSIRKSVEDMRLMNPIALVENHPSCMINSEGQKVLPNGQSWRHEMLLLCYSSKILSKANSLLMLQYPNLGKLVGYCFHSLPLPSLLSSFLQSRDHRKLLTKQGGNECDSNIELDSYSDVEQDDDEKQYDQIPPFKPVTKSQFRMLAKDEKIACFDEYNYKAKLHWKKQWKNEMKKRENFYQGPLLENLSVPLPDMVLPSLFDCDSHTYRYCFLESNSTILTRPILNAHGWDHDYGYDGVSMGETLAILNRFPTNIAAQIIKDKKEFYIHLDSSIAAKHGENASSLAGFNIQTIGQHLAYILHGETKIKNIKKNKITGGFLVTILDDIVATGLKVEDQLSLGKWLSLVASTGVLGTQGDAAYGANFEACLKDNYPTGQHVSTLGLSLMKWRQDLALGANLQSQFSIGKGSKMALRFGINDKLNGQITVRTNTSEHVQIVLLGLVPVAASICKRFWHSESSFT